MQGNILQCYPVMLTWQVMLPSRHHLPRAARAERSNIIKRGKKGTYFLISVSSPGTAKLTKGTAKTQINQIFNTG